MYARYNCTTYDETENIIYARLSTYAYILTVNLKPEITQSTNLLNEFILYRIESLALTARFTLIITEIHRAVELNFNSDAVT